MNDLWRDITYSLRLLRRNKWFAAVTILSLAVGLSLAATTFAVVNAYLIRTFPFPAADRLYHVNYTPPRQPEPRGVANMDWSALRDMVEFTDNSASARFYLTDGGYTEEVFGLLVARGAGDSLGIRTVLGRSLLEEDFEPQSDPVAVIGHTMWRERFGSDPNVIGRRLPAYIASRRDEPVSYRIVGVLPPNFRYVRVYDRGTLEMIAPQKAPYQTYMVRLRKGIAPSLAERRITEAVTASCTAFPPNWPGVHLESVQDRYVGNLKPMVVAIMVAAAIVLVIVSINVAVLMLLRALRRQREMAVRVALGAGVAHIARLLAVEACLICSAAVAIAVALTAYTLRLLAPLIEERLGRPAPGGASSIGLDPAVLLATAAAGLLIAISISFIPLLMPWKRRLDDSLQREGRSGTDGPGMRRARSTLLAIEIASSLALLIGCGLMIRTVVNLVRTDLGYGTHNIVRLRLALPERTYLDTASFVSFFDRFTQQLSQTTTDPVVYTNFISFYEAPKHPVEIASSSNSSSIQSATAGVTAVSDRYFEVLGIKIKEGRAFTSRDRPESEQVAIVSESFARTLAREGSAIGRRIRTAELTSFGAPLTSWRTIVGVANDIHQSFTDTDQKDVYLPFLQAANRYVPLFISSNRPPSYWLAALRKTVSAIDPEVLISGGETLDDEARKQLAGPRFLMSLLTGFALFAALVAILGIYGVTAYTVHQRDREVAIRMALGASPGKIIRMFLSHTGLILGLGIVVGLIGAAALTRTLANQLYGVRPFDIVSILAASLFMILAGLLATWHPARRASRKNPMASLNADT